MDCESSQTIGIFQSAPASNAGLSDTPSEELDDHVTNDFSNLREADLESLGVRRASSLLVYNAKNAMSAARNSANRGQEHIWSSDMLVHHLNMLKSFASPDVAGAQLWIDAFFFRVKAMLDCTDNGLVLGLKQYLDVPVHRQMVLSGFVDYALFMGPKHLTEQYFPSSDLNLERNRNGRCLFIDEAESFGVPLKYYLPQTVGKMFAGMKAMEKDFIRGGLTDGGNWIFIILEADASGTGAVYHCTDEFPLFGSTDPDPYSSASLKPSLLKARCDVVAAVISGWVEKSHCKLDESEVFTYRACTGQE
ncbi:hypothetical protein DFP72DRAFT_928775 [Ephemerocybe angulata]|uniref:Uncharacterized protein n=1 Tax=Ephemerocybe angulata TaxID=980116 RepID=A0A8H6LW80_9AGAR|nr:hypothetical protein DFP72DRAFT_928775 [Tulosesus angulatus]